MYYTFISINTRRNEVSIETENRKNYEKSGISCLGIGFLNSHQTEDQNPGTYFLFERLQLGTYGQCIQLYRIPFNFIFGMLQ